MFASREAQEHARALLRKHCSKAEADLLLRCALEAPPRGATGDEAVAAIAMAVTMNPPIREELLKLAALPKEDRQRAQEIAAFVARDLPRFNVGHPHCADEFFETLRGLLRSLWTDSHQSCLDGAVMVGVIETVSGWSVNPFAIVKCMRETADADRSMRLGYGR